MTMITLGIASLEDAKRRAAAAFRGEAQGAYISFASAPLLWKVLTAKRWEILNIMTGQGPLAIREIARRTGRDVKAVHGDVQALIVSGIIERGETGVVFPYDGVHVDFVLGQAA